MPRIDIDLDQLAASRIPPVLVVWNVEVAESRTHDEQHVCLTSQVIGRGTLRQVAQGMLVRNHRPAGERRDHGAIQQFGQRQQRRIGMAAINAAAGENHGRFRTRQKIGRGGEFGVRDLRLTGTAGTAGVNGGGRGVAGRIQRRQRHLELHRPGAAGPHFAKGHSHQFRDALPLEYRGTPLDGGPEQVKLILTLKGGGSRGIHDPAAVLRGNREHRHTFMTRRDQPGYQIGGARSRIAEHDGDLAGGFIEPLGHVHAGGLVADGNESNSMIIQSGKERVDLRARQAEDEFHTFIGHRSRKQFAAGYVSHAAPLKNLLLTRLSNWY